MFIGEVHVEIFDHMEGTQIFIKSSFMKDFMSHCKLDWIQIEVDENHSN